MDAFGITLLSPDAHSNTTLHVSILAGSHAAGLTVTVNGHAVPVGTVAEFGAGAGAASLSRPSHDHVSLTAGDFRLALTNADDFINIETRLATHIVAAGAKRMDMSKIKGYKDTHMLKKVSYKDIHIHGNSNAQAHSS